MSSPQHALYQASCQQALQELALNLDHRAAIGSYEDAITLLFHLDLEPARPFLMEGYAEKPRGGRPWDPVCLLRSVMLSLLVGFPKVHDWVAQLRASPVLRALCGFPILYPKTEEERDLQTAGRAISPGVGTFYDFFHRLHDGALRRPCEHQTPPSLQQRARAQTPRLPQRKKDARSPGDDAPKEKKGSSQKKRSKKDTPAPETEDAPEDAAVREAVTRKLQKLLRSKRALENPKDFMQRLFQILHAVALTVSAQKEMLGDLQSLVVSGDGSPLSSAADSHGIRICDCNPRKSCDCPRRYSDPDARLGWDSYRKCYYFGYNFYEVSTFFGGHDLPLWVFAYPANETDPTASMKTIEFLFKELQELEPEWTVTIFIGDKGHDGLPMHDFLRDWNLKPVIPLRGKVPAVHPEREEIALSDRAIPLCEAGVERASWGTAGPDKPMFVCPVKANKVSICPLAPTENKEWTCEEGALAPTRNLNTKDNARLFPEIARNSAKYEKLYKRRSSCERSNAHKKVGFDLEACRHRRHSFWQIRLTTMAILQHAHAWVAHLDAKAFVRELLGEVDPGVLKTAA